MMRRSLYPLLAAIVVAGQPAHAADVTPDGAAALRGMFERYLGPAVAGEQGGLAIVPDGDAFRVTVDLGKATAPLSKLGISIQEGAVSLRVAPQPDGKWRVSGLTWPAQMVMRVPQQVATYGFTGGMLEGLFDPELATFSDAKSGFDQITAMTVSPMGTIDTNASKLAVTQQATAAAGGGVDAKMHEDIGTFVERIRAGGAEGADKSAPAFDMTLKTEGASVDVGMQAVRMRELFDVWAFVVAHPSRPQLATDQSGFKALLTGALPIFAGMTESGSTRNLSVDTPVGRFEAASMGATLSLTGAVPDGRYRFGFDMAGLKVPSTLLQPWQTRLVPTAANVAFGVAGVNLEAGARELIAALDLSGHPAIKPEDEGKITAAIVGPQGVTVHIDPSRITSDVLEVAVTGDVTVTPPRSLHMTVTGKGVEETLAILREAAAKDPTAASALQSLSGAQALGRSGAEGMTEWVLEMGDGGQLTVNGQKVGGP